MKNLLHRLAIPLTLLLAACASPASPTPTTDPQAAYTLAAQTLDAQLAAALQLTQRASLTRTALAPTATFTLTPIPPTLTFTPTLFVPPTLTVLSDLNCRHGPGLVYDVLALLEAGTETLVLGRSQDDQWLLVENPASPAENCWVQLSSAIEVEGELGGLPFFNPPPTPTGSPVPTAEIGFFFSGDNIHNCDGQPHAIFSLHNTGPVAFLSGRLEIRDLTTDLTLSITDSNDPFMASPSDCPKGSLPLLPGQTGYLGGPIAGAVSGDLLRAVARLCTEKAMAGLCLNRNYQFTLP